MFCLNLLYQKKVKIGTYRLPASHEIVTKKKTLPKKKNPQHQKLGGTLVSIHHPQPKSRSRNTRKLNKDLMLFCQDIVLSFIIFQVHHLCRLTLVRRSRIRQGCTNKDGIPQTNTARDGLPGCPEPRSWFITVSPLRIGFGVTPPFLRRPKKPTIYKKSRNPHQAWFQVGQKKHGLENPRGKPTTSPPRGVICWPPGRHCPKGWLRYPLQVVAPSDQPPHGNSAWCP